MTGHYPGSDALERLVNAGLVAPDNRSVLQPELAEAVPSLANGLWTLLPDGGMQTTWKIKPNVYWHDGQPFTADDVLFTAQLGRDRELPFYNAGFGLMTSVSAPDPLTVVVQWSQPYILADAMFTYTRATRLLPMPRHILGTAYSEDKVKLLTLPYWSEEFVGTGPFKVREFVPGEQVLLDANEAYFQGKPKVDRLEIRFMSDTNAALASVFARALDMTIGRGFSLDQGVMVRGQGWDGKVEFTFSDRYVVIPQLLNPSPAVLEDVRLRRALLHAIDRQELVDTLHHGQTQVSDTYVLPFLPAYAAVQPTIARYDYDPRRASQLIEDLGYRRGPDGLLRDSADQELNLEIRATAEDDAHRKTTLAVGDFWQRLGVKFEPLFVPRSQRDRAFLAAFPAFQVTTIASRLESIGIYMYGPDAPRPIVSRQVVEKPPWLLLRARRLVPPIARPPFPPAGPRASASRSR